MKLDIESPPDPDKDQEVIVGKVRRRERRLPKLILHPRDTQPKSLALGPFWHDAPSCSIVYMSRSWSKPSTAHSRLFGRCAQFLK